MFADMMYCISSSCCGMYPFVTCHACASASQEDGAVRSKVDRSIDSNPCPPIDDADAVGEWTTEGMGAVAGAAAV